MVADAAFHEIGQSLRRRHLCPTPGLPGQFFEVLLEFKSFQGPKRLIAFQVAVHIDLYDDAGVGETVVPFGGRHAVHNDFPGRCGSGNDETAWAHTKGIDAAPLDLLNQGVSRCRQQFMAPASAMVLNGIDDIKLELINRGPVVSTSFVLSEALFLNDNNNIL